MEPFTLEEIRESAIRIVIRLALGAHVVRGPRRNILELESRVAWATVASELHREGYGMVSFEAYGTACGEPPSSVMEMIETDGTLFALVYPGGDEEGAVVPLPEREERRHPGPFPV